MSEKILKGKGLSRRQFMRGAAGAAFGAVLAACTPKATEVAAPGETQDEAPKQEAVRLEWYTCYGTWGEAGLQSIVDDYVQKNPDVTFAPIVYAQDSTQGALEGLLSRIAAGTAPDVALMWDSPVSLGVRGALAALDQLMALSLYSKETDWPEMMFRSCKFRGKSYGFPSYNAIYGIWYNSDFFEKKGISIKREDFPTTWDGLKELSKQFTEYDGQTPKTVGYFPLWNVHTDQWFQFNGGGSYDYENAAYHMDLPQNIETLEYAARWIDEEYQGNYDGVKGTGWDFWDDQGGEPAWQDGRMVMIQGGNWSVGIYNSIPPQYNWDVARFPLGPSSTSKNLYSSYYGNWTMIIAPAGSKNIDQAFKFVDWLNGDGVMNWITNGNSDAPGSKKFYEKNKDFITPLFKEHLDAAKAADLQAFFEDQAAHAADMFSSPIASFQWDQAMRAAERVLKKAASAAEALKEAQDACSAELDKILKSS